MTRCNALLDLGLAARRADRQASTPDVAAGARHPAPTPPRAPRSSRGSPVDYVVSLGVEPTPTPEPTPAPVAIPDLPGCRRGGRASTRCSTPGSQPGDADRGLRPPGQPPVPSSRHRPRRGHRGPARLHRSTTSCRWASSRRPPPSRRPPRCVIPDLRGCRRGGRRQRAPRCRPRARRADRGLRRRHRRGRRHRHRPRRGHRGPAAAPRSTTSSRWASSRRPPPSRHPPRSSSPTCRGRRGGRRQRAPRRRPRSPAMRTEAFDAEVAAGAVIGTDPAAGTEVQPGSTGRLRRLAGHRADAHPRADTRPGRHPRPARLDAR